MRFLRTLSTRHLIALAAVVVAVAAGGTALAVAAGGRGGSTPPAKPLAQALHDSLAAPDVAGITSLLTKLDAHADVSAGRPTAVAGRPAYSVHISPKHDGGLLGYAELAWDAGHGVPLRVGIYAQGSSKPVLELAATDISYGSVPTADVTVTPPAGVKTIDLTAPSKPETSGGKVDFPVVAPATLVGLPRQDLRAAGSGELVVYGQGLGAIVVIEHKAGDTTGKQGMLSGLP